MPKWRSRRLPKTVRKAFRLKPSKSLSLQAPRLQAPQPTAWYVCLVTFSNDIWIASYMITWRDSQRAQGTVKLCLAGPAAACATCVLLPPEKFAISSRGKIDQVALSNRGALFALIALGCSGSQTRGCVNSSPLSQLSTDIRDPPSLPHDIRLVFRLPPSLFKWRPQSFRIYVDPAAYSISTKIHATLPS